jgi:hypothetical protein
MNEKIKKLAVKVEALVKYFGTPQDTYDDLVKLAKNQKDYFIYLGEANFVKLAIYIYSLKETKGFELADKWINNLAFAELVTTENNKYTYTCDECGGDGYTDCSECSGRGKVQCNNCEGKGELECPECDGDGRQMGDGEWEDCESCDGEGETECEYCDGEGDITCDYCNGDQQTQCENCDGQGEIDSDTDVVYSTFTIVTWNKDIQDACELNEGIVEPAMSEYDFDRLRDEYIILFFDDTLHGPLNILENEMYCVDYSDDPNLVFTQRMHVDLKFKRNNANHLFHT